jgi:hypothetical protein
MRKETILTRKIAEQFLAEGNSVNLSDFSSMEDAASQVLAKHSEGLWLDGLASLSDNAAKALGKHKGEDLSLNGLTSLSDTATQALSRHASGVVGGLCLDGLKSLSNVAARALAQHAGKLKLASLTEITDWAGPALADDTTDETFRIFEFNLNNITAEVLAKFEKHIPKGGHKGISLIGPDMGDDIAKVLAKSEFDDVAFHGLTALTDKAAEALSQFKGNISFYPYSSTSSCEWDSWLKTLSTRAAVALSKHKGGLLQFCSTSIVLEPAAAAALLSHPCFDATPWIKGYLKRRTKPKSGSKSTLPNNGRNTGPALRKRRSVSKGKILTKQIAEEFLNNTDSIDLSDFASIEDDAAQVLAQHKGELRLKGLKMLNDAVAHSLAKHEGTLLLKSVTSLSDPAVEALAQHKGEIWFDWARSLLTKQVAEEFLKDNQSVDLTFFAFIENAAAQTVAQHKGELRLNGLKSISDTAAHALAQHEGYLGLDGLTSISDATAHALAHHKGGLSFYRLKSLSHAAASSLAKHEGGLRLSGTAKTALTKVKKTN